MRFTGLLFSVLFSAAAWEFCATVAHPSLPHVVHYEVVQLQPIKGRVKRSASSQQKYPDAAEYALSVDGNNFTISLEKNRELLGKDYALTYYTKDGIKVMKPPSNKDLCYYQGHIQDVQNSSVSVGLCSGMRGFLRAGDQVYLIEPLEASVRGDHAVYKQEHLRTKRAVFDYVNDTVYDIGPRFAGLYNGRNSKNKALAAAQRFVEMVLVVDNTEYKKIGNLKSVEKRMLEVANHVDKLYRPLNIRVMLVGLEVWSYGDQFEVSPVPKITLDRFSQWRQNSLLTRKKHDNAQFVTATDFDGSTVGLAPLYAMCSPTSGAVNEDHSNNPLGVASTIAHEMGHNLGMSHDDASCSCPSGSSQGCVMGESIGMVYPESFSTCSKVALEMFLQNYDSSCLLNVPNEDDLIGGPVCGNAFLEQGEECDCGTVEECKNACCNATTCRLTEGSKCAHGECCQNCQLKHTGSLCRASAHDCDLEEYCSGVSAQCPKDDYKMNGLPCDYNQGYCYNGQCPSLQERCKKLWGPDADVDIDTCFDHNRYDKNCPKDRSGRCAQEHMRCGKIYCSGGNEFPITRQKFTFSSRMKECYTAIEASSADSVGMVATGTKCGTNKVCYDSLCQDISVYGTENCSAKCNNHGVCNHEKQCHCDPGWAPPYCDVKLSDVPNNKEAVITGVTTTIAILLLITLAIGASVCCKKQKTPFLKKRPLKDTSTYSGQSNPVFQSSSAKNSPRCGPPRISQPTFLESTANQSCKPLFPTTAPTRPAPQPPKVIAEPTMEQNAKPSFPSHVVPVYANQTKPLLPPAKPLPPSRPLPPLTSKPEFKPKSPPLPPVKPSGTQPAWNPPQGRAPPKVPLKPPTKFV